MTGNGDMKKTAQALFSPAVALMNRLGYTRKFALLWLMSLAAVMVMFFGFYNSLNREIVIAQRELEGLALIEPISHAIQDIQHHRGLSAMQLGGDDAVRDRRAASEREAAKSFAALERRLPAALKAGRDWQDIEAGWQRLRSEGLVMTADGNLTAYIRLVEQMLFFEVRVADEYALTLDPQIDTYYLIDTTIGKLPFALDHLGQLRAYGASMLGRKRVSEAQRTEIHKIIGMLNDALAAAEINLGKTIHHNPALRERLSTMSENITGSAQRVVGIMEADILGGRFTLSPEDFFAISTSAIDGSYRQVYESLLPATGALLEARIARVQTELYTSIGSAFLLILIVGYFAVGIYLAILGSVKSLVRSSQDFAGGDLTRRVRLEARDEIGQIGEGFNRMAERLDALLDAHRQTEKDLLESQNLYSTIFDFAAVGIARIAPDGRWLEVNRKLCEIVGYTREELFAHTFQDITHPDDLEADLDQVRRMLAGEIATYSMEKRYFRKSGEIVWINLSVTLVWRADGRPDYFISVVEDINERKRAEETIRQSEHRYHSLFDNMLEGYAHCRMLYENGQPQDIVYLDVNAAFGTLTGLSNVVGKKVSEIIPGMRESNPEVFERYGRVARGGEPEQFETYVAPMGIWFSLAVYSAEEDCFIAVFDNITERKRAELGLLESRARLHKVIETALDAVVQMDDKGVITGWNPQAEKIFGWSREEAVGRPLGETIVPPQYREAHRQGLERFLSTGESSILNSRIEMTALRRDGSEFPAELSIVPIRAAGGYEFSGFIRDITERKKAESLIWQQANFDALTGIPNRHMFFDRLAQEIRKAERTRLPLALLYIDLDRFKEVNDTLGHSIGDKLLVETTRRLAGCVREADTVARLGGDEFVIILADLVETGRIDTLAQDILDRLAEPFHLDGEMAYLSASIGITLYPHDAAEMEGLVKNADQAMYAAKNAGRNRFGYFTPSMQQAAQIRLRLTNDLRTALAAGQFRVYFQPIVELATGRIRKAEVLIRWQHPARGMVSPAEFIPLAEETGLILEIGDWVFVETVRQVKRWRTLHDPEFQISVNMSPAQFYGAANCRAWIAHLREAGLPGQSLVIEITEGLLLEKEQSVMDRLLQFREADIPISLDDFGTGYSSLSYLQKFDLDYLKIDQSFTRNLAPGSNNLALSEAIIVMAHKLGMKVIAEGVETEEQQRLLAVAGCDYAQGYLYSKPLPAEEFEKLLAAAPRL